MADARKILIIEDDPVIRQILEISLKSDFKVSVALNLKDAGELINNNPDTSAVILDRTLPDGDGLGFATELRRDPRFENIQILFLTGLVSESDRISGFFAGADDYVTKPFSVLELKARLNARLRRAFSQKLTAGDLELDLDSQRAYSLLATEKREIDLTRTELKILAAFIQSHGNLLTRESLLSKVWGPDCHVSDRVVDSHISHLRKKIEGHRVALQSLRGEGYRLEIDLKPRTQAA